MRKVLLIFCSVFLSLLTVLSLFLFYPKESNKSESVKYLEIWHIDGIEGGIGSRTSLLKKVASEYAKSHGLVIRVIMHTVNSCEKNFEKGVYPDIISYSNGLNLPYERLLSFNGDKEKSYAKEWCKGGYLLISRKNQNIKGVIISQQSYTVPLLAYHLSQVKIPISQTEQSDKAIYSFYRDKSLALLGTQRDLYRLENKDIEIDVKVLNGYNDLYQYFSLLCTEKNYLLATAFIDYFYETLSNKNLLKDIGMLSKNGYIEGQCEEKLKIFVNSALEYRTLPLISKQQVQKLQKQAFSYDKEQESIKTALKHLK